MVHVRFKRALETLFLSVAFLSIGACSSGLGTSSSGSSTSNAISSTNLRFGFDPGMVLSDAIDDTTVAGGLIPGLNGGADRPVIFLAFSTSARADDADGNGNALDRSMNPPSDVAGTSDIFVAAVAADQIDERAFTYSLAGKFRHPRCTTCHSMNVTPTSETIGGPSTAFATGFPHPGMSLPVGTDANCGDCHRVEDWRAPAAGLDLRNLSAMELFSRAQQAINNPAGPQDHFENDSRVLWALGDGGGALPFGNVADDDHDGILEPEDSDGISRTVPGGPDDFIARLRAWRDSGQKFDNADALHDIVLASRALGINSAGNGDSHSPSTHYRPNAAFDPMVSNPDLVPTGFLRVAYASTATDMVGGTGNGATDVFVIDVNVFHRTSGMIDLVTDSGSQTLVSRATAGDANGNSTSPDIGGPSGERVSFVSTATNLIAGFQDNNGTAADVFAAEPGIGSMVLVSHVPGSASAGGDGQSSSARIDTTGKIVAFESVATNLVVGDTNGERDVFYTDAFQSGFDVARASLASGGIEATGGPSTDPSVYVFPASSEVRIAYTSTKTDLVSSDVPGVKNVYLFDSRMGGTTTLLNQIVGPQGTPTLATNDPSQNADNAEVSADGQSVLFESTSANIDFVRPGDDNRVMDVMLADLARLDADGFVLPYTLSVGPDGSSANGASSSPSFASLRPAGDDFQFGVAAFRTRATNLSNSDATGDANLDGIPDFDNIVLMFVREGASVVANFEATPEKPGVGRVVTFESTSSGSPTSFLWDFGDGATSTEANPSHVYENPGVYTVTLTASGELGEDVQQRVDYVRVVGPSNAMFTSTKDAALAGVPQAPATDVPNDQNISGAIVPGVGASLRFDFNSTGSSDCPDMFDWRLTEVDIDTGMPIADPVILGTSEDAMTTLTLSSRANWDLELVATGPGGAGASAAQRIEVWNRAEASFQPITAVTGSAPLTVTFQDTSTGDVEGLRWQRDGADFSTASQATETFPEGVHQVRLIADGRGGDQSISSPVTITSAGILTASFSPSNQEFGNSVATNLPFTNNSSGTIGVPLFYRWDFGNGVTSTLESPGTVTFSTSTENVQTYTVNLVASTTDPAPTDCTGLPAINCDEASGTVRFFPTPSLSLSASADAANPRQITLTPMNVRGDGTGTNPSFTFFRSATNGSTANMSLGTFPNANARTFTMPDDGFYDFAVRLDTDGPNGSTQTVTSAEVTQESYAIFTTDVFPIMSANCVTCHSTTASCATNGNLIYGVSPSASTIYNRIVDMNRSGCLSGCGDALRYIDSSSTDPNDSFLYRKLANTQGAGCGGVMPPATSGLSASQRAVFRSWIRGGAAQ